MLADVVTPVDLARRRLADGSWDDTTLPAVVAARADEHPSDVAVIDEFGELSWAELWDSASRVAGWLEHRGVGTGDVVSIQLPNRVEAVIFAVGALAAGAAVNPLLPSYGAHELTHVFETAAPKVIATPTAHRSVVYAPMVQTAARSAGTPVVHVVTGPDEPPPGTIGLGEVLDRSPGRPAPVDPGAVSELIFTSGTEATPKAIMHTERTTNSAVRAAAADLALDATTVVWMPSPIGHSTGFNYGLRLALVLGHPLVLQDRWDAGRAVDLVRTHGCSYTLAATTFLQDRVTAARDRGVRLDALTHFGCGGAPVPAPLVRAASEVGIRVLRLYGSTEVLVATWNRPDSTPAQREHTDGRAMSRCEVEVRSPDGTRCAPGAVGEIFVRGPSTSVGFFADPERTAATFSPDGWVRSGDLATLDAAGHLTVVGRRKEIIIRGGLNIAPREVEDLIAELDEVDRVAVVGVPDQRLGERTCACVVTRGGVALDLGRVVDHLRSRGLAPYKLPERLVVLDELPTTASGKVQKHVLRRLLGLDGCGEDR